MKARYINEKFTEEGDPIRDMGIGLYSPHDFKSSDELNMFIAEMLPSILRIRKLPEDILDDKCANYYLYFSKNMESKLIRLSKYVNKYLTVNGKPASHKFSDIHVALKKLHPELKSWLREEYME